MQCVALSSWHDRAACRGMPVRVFYPEDPRMDRWDVAQEICAACPVRGLCLEDALARNERYGMRGGLTPRQRRRRRELQRRGGPDAA